MARWHLSCDHCEASAWVGARGDVRDAWCEACQTPAGPLAGGTDVAMCAQCGAPLTTHELRFEELYGQLQHLAAVLGAWHGDATRLDAILPERPRFLTDLNPPGIDEHDSSATRAALERLASGAFGEASERLVRALATAPAAEQARLWRASGIAAERRGDLGFAEQAFSHALERNEEASTRLARGALRARRGAFIEAREDFARAGDGREASWNRAALRLFEAVATSTGLPAPATIEAAREEAGPPSSYWSDHTVGRLLWTLLVERAVARRGDGCADARVLRAAEGQLEFATFWDRALVVSGYAKVDLTAEVAAAAAALASQLLLEVRAEPFMRGAAMAPIAAALAAAATALEGREPGVALGHVAAVMEREDVSRYRMPCVRCGRGSVGVDRVEDE